MRIFLGMIQGPFDFANRFLPEHVLNFFRIIMHMIGRDLRLIGEV